MLMRRQSTSKRIARFPTPVWQRWHLASKLSAVCALVTFILWLIAVASRR